MSENKALTTQELPTTDLSEWDMKKVQAYMDAGLPNISSVTQEMIAKLFDMYLNGIPYGKISTTLNIKKDMIMYLSYKYNWFTTKQEYLDDLNRLMAQRVVESKLQSQDFLMQIQQFFQKKLGKTMMRYMATGSDTVANEVDLKDIATYLKTLEALHKTGNPGGVDRPAVGLNLGDGVTVSKNDDGTVEITPKQKAVGEILKQFADSRRQEEKK